MKTLGWIVAVIAWASVVVWLHGCGPTAEAVYTADLLRCVDRATTLAESRACRAAVDLTYRLDAGADR